MRTKCLHRSLHVCVGPVQVCAYRASTDCIMRYDMYIYIIQYIYICIYVYVCMYICIIYIYIIVIVRLCFWYRISTVNCTPCIGLGIMLFHLRSLDSEHIFQVIWQHFPFTLVTFVTAVTRPRKPAKCISGKSSQKSLATSGRRDFQVWLCTSLHICTPAPGKRSSNVTLKAGWTSSCASCRTFSTSPLELAASEVCSGSRPFVLILWEPGWN